jgi:hypothetical protein
MRQLFITLLCAIFFATPVAFAQQGGAAPKKTGPQFKFKGGDVHDFGQVKKGPIVNYSFEFTNTGKEPLIIRDVNPSCGCTNAEWDKEPILPGKKGRIKVGLRTAEQKGNFMKEVYIQSNAINGAPDGRYTLRIRGLAIDSAASK